MKKLILILLALSLACTALISCDNENIPEAPSENSEEAVPGVNSYDFVIDEFAKYYLELDENDGIYINTLLTVEKFLNGEATEEEAIKTLEDTIAVFNTKKDNFKKYEMSDEMYGHLRNCGLHPEEFEIVANHASDQLSEYIGNLNSMYLYATKDPNYIVLPEDLPFWTGINIDTYNILTDYYFYGYINYFFSGYTGENLESLNEKLISKVENIPADEYEWLTDKTVIEEKTGAILDEYETVVDSINEYNSWKEETILGMGASEEETAGDEKITYEVCPECGDEMYNSSTGCMNMECILY